MDSGSGHTISLGQLSQTLTASPVREDGTSIKVQRLAADVPAFQPRSSHAGAHSLDDEIAFQFCDGRDDDDERAAQRTARVEVLAEAEELHIQPTEFIEHFEEVLH